MIAVWVLLAACVGGKDTDRGSGKSDDSGASSPFVVVADEIPGGVLLGAWPTGDELLMVGGDLDLLNPAYGSLARWNGEALCVEEGVTDTTLWWIHGRDPIEWYAVGAEGRILHESGGSRTDESVPTASTLYGVWMADDGKVYAVGGDVRDSLRGEIWVKEGGVWSLFAGDLDGVVFKVWDRWFVGDGVAFHLEDGELVSRPPPDGVRLLTVRGRADDDVWAVGGDPAAVLLHWDGTQWNDVAVSLDCTAQPLNGVWTGAGEDVWIAGNSGAMARFDGSAWECPVPPTSYESFHAVTSFKDEIWWLGGNLFSAGNNYGTLARYGADSEPLEVGACP